MMVDTTIVDIVEIRDRPLVMSLADGSVLRLRVDVLEVSRFQDEWDPDGNPLYNVRSGNILVVLDSPQELRKKVQ